MQYQAGSDGDGPAAPACVVPAPRAQEALGRPAGSRRGPGRARASRGQGVQPPQDHALAQRPGADLQFGQAEQVHGRVGHDRARRRAAAPGPGTPRAAAARSAAVVRGQPLRQRGDVGVAAAPAARRSPRWTARRRRSGPAAGTSWTWPPRGPAGRPASPCRPAARSRPARACAAAAPRRRDGGSPASQSLVSRPRRAAARSRRRAPRPRPRAISSDPPPMSSMSSRPEDQPNQRRAARNVSRDSSAPGSTWMSTPVSCLDPGQHLVAVGRVPDGGGGEGQQLLHALVLGDLQRLVHERAQLLGAPSVQPVAGVQVVAQPQLGLVRERGDRRRAPG